jgi:amino acid transporter
VTHTTKSSLQSEVVGLLGAVTLGIVMLSPAMTLYGNFGPSFISAGKAAPLAFIWALIATLPTAASYALLSRDYPDSGSAASWTARAAGAQAGKWAGWIVFLYYFNNFIIQPVTLGVFLNDLLTTLGLHPGFGTYALGALLCCAGPAWIAYRGIAPSAHGALSFLLFETAVVAALCLTVFLVAPHTQGVHFSVEGFSLTSSPAGVSGLFRAMIFGMLSFCGFDVISTLGEEAKMPRKLIPQATFVALILFGSGIILGLWILTYAVSLERLKQVADAGGMPISEIARQYWGGWAALVPVTAISAALGIAIATSVGASRVLFSMGRSGLAPARFAQLHPRYQVPWNAMNAIFGVGLVAAVGTGALLGPYNAYAWWGTTSTFFAMLTYLMVNLANIVLFKHRIFKSLSGFTLHGAIPVFGIAVGLYILVRSFFIELWGQGWANGQSVIAFDLLCAAAAAISLCWPGRTPTRPAHET